MNLTSPAEVKRLLAEYQLRPKKRLGQNFLIDQNILDKVIAAASIGPKSLVLEIGPGLGTVTTAVAELAERVVAVETDYQLIPVLTHVLEPCMNVELVEADFLKLDLQQFLAGRFGGRRCTAIANLPYYITSPIIAALVESKSLLDRAVLMVQLEVAERLTAQPGTSEYGALTVFVNYHCDVTTVAKVSRTVFHPSPEVDSAIVRLVMRDDPLTSVPDEGMFFRIVRAAFGQRRKTLLRALSGSQELGWSRDIAQAALAKAGIDPGRRGETLSIDEFGKLARSVECLS